jgi:trigger factor
MSGEPGYLREIESPSGLKRVLKFEIPRDAVEAEIDRNIDELRKDISVPGFRKGKVPKDMAKARYAKTARQEAVEKIIQDAYGKALEEKSLKPVTPAAVTSLDFEEGKPLTFSIEIEVLPEVKIENYKGIKVQKIEREVKDQEVDEEIENLRDRFATTSSVDREAAQGDIVAIDYWRKDEEGNEVADSKVTGFPFELGRQKVLKEFDEALAGARKGDTKDITVQYPEDFDQHELRGKKVTFGVEVSDVKDKTLPELSDDFAIRVGAESLLDLRLKVRESIEKMYQDDAKSRMKAQIVQGIIDANPFEVPEAMIEASLDAMMESYKKEAGQEDEAAKQQLDEIRKKMRPVAVNVVKEQFIVDEIAKREGITVEQADIEKMISSFCERMNVPADQVREWAGKSGEIRRWRHNILRDKVMNFLLESSGVEG